MKIEPQAVDAKMSWSVGEQAHQRCTDYRDDHVHHTESHSDVVLSSPCVDSAHATNRRILDGVSITTSPTTAAVAVGGGRFGLVVMVRSI